MAKTDTSAQDEADSRARHLAAVKAPLERVVALGGQFAHVAGALLQSFEALFAGPPAAPEAPADADD